MLPVRDLPQTFNESAPDPKDLGHPALHETIRLMAEIDKAIDAHGGWPAAFAPRAV